MDGALLILPLVGGYVFVSRFYVTQFKLSREDGHRLYFRSAGYGVLLFVLAFILRIALLHFNFYNTFEDFVRGIVSPMASNAQQFQPDFLLTCLYSYSLGILLPLLLNFVLQIKLPDNIRLHYLRIAVKDNDFEQLLLNAATNKQPICVTMENSKVYVGFIKTTPDPTLVRKYIGILPLMSGYRQSPGGEFQFTTFYEHIYTHDEIKRPVDEFVTVLPIDKIQSINQFDAVAYNLFQDRLANDASVDLLPDDSDSDSQEVA